MAKYVGNVHLSKVEEEFGTGAGSRVIRDLVAQGLAKRREAEQAERAKTRPDGKVNPHVSDAGKCPRRVFFSLTGEPETNPPDTDSLINFAVGNAVEEAFAYLIEPLGGEVIREVRVEIPVRDTVVTGRADFLVALPQFNSLLELKSVNSRSMKFMLKNQELGKEDHRRQLNQYLHASQIGVLRRPHVFTEPGGTCVGCGFLRRRGLGGDTAETRENGGVQVVVPERYPNVPRTVRTDAKSPGRNGNDEGAVQERATQGPMVLPRRGLSQSSSSNSDGVAIPVRSEATAGASRPSGEAQEQGGTHPDSEGGVHILRGEDPTGGRGTDEEGGCPTPFDRGYLIYIVKDATRGEPPVHAFEVKYDEGMAMGDLERMAYIKSLSDGGADPGIPQEFLDHMAQKKKHIWFCQYCPYFNRCWDGKVPRD